MERITHLYRHFDKDNVLLYVGISLSALNRLGQHKEHAHWFSQITNVKIETFKTRREAEIAEKNAIVDEAPLHNIVHKPKPIQIKVPKIKPEKPEKTIVKPILDKPITPEGFAEVSPTGAFVRYYESIVLNLRFKGHQNRYYNAYADYFGIEAGTMVEVEALEKLVGGKSEYKWYSYRR